VIAPGGQQASPDTHAVVEVRIPAAAAQISSVRVVAADLAARQDFDIDAVSDLRMAVDEACATLVPLARPGSVLSCRFLTGADLFEVIVTVPVAGPDARIPQNTFGWRVLSTLTDSVEALDPDAFDGNGPAVGIRLRLGRERIDG
jgi:serine/threonine-protein kinase RsbW